MKQGAAVLLLLFALPVGCAKKKCLSWETRTVYQQRCVERDPKRGSCSRYESVPVEKRVCVEWEKPEKKD
jgi:hypothetical protein